MSDKTFKEFYTDDKVEIKELICFLNGLVKEGATHIEFGSREDDGIVSISKFVETDYTAFESIPMYSPYIIDARTINPDIAKP
jgi:hypothetical protein